MPAISHPLRQVLSKVCRVNSWYAALTTLCAAALFTYFGPRQGDAKVDVNAREIVEILKDSVVRSCNDEAKEVAAQVDFSRTSSFRLATVANQSTGAKEASVIARQGRFVCIEPVSGQTIVRLAD